MSRSLMCLCVFCVFFSFCWFAMPNFDVKAFVFPCYILVCYVLLSLRSLFFSNRRQNRNGTILGECLEGTGNCRERGKP